MNCPYCNKEMEKVSETYMCENFSISKFTHHYTIGIKTNNILFEFMRVKKNTTGGDLNLSETICGFRNFDCAFFENFIFANDLSRFYKIKTEKELQKILDKMEIFS